ncbi:MAG: hydrolase [Chitinophagales bacterium]|nr:hydrolase [Chitinophagales bacterium]
MRKILPKSSDSLLIVVDVQERLFPVMNQKEVLLKNINTLILGAKELAVETIITEQYPRGLGHTLTDVERSQELDTYEKMEFSCLLNDAIIKRVEDSGKKNILVCGIESHICILKTVIDAISKEYNVYVVADAVSSRTEDNKVLALEMMRQAGAYIISVEMILFMLMEKAGTDSFKTISKLIK